MLALALLLATLASANPVHEVKIEAQRYASTPRALGASQEVALAQKIIETCGDTGDKLIKIHRHALKIVGIGGHARALHAKVSGGEAPSVLIMDYPNGILEASFECP